MLFVGLRIVGREGGCRRRRTHSLEEPGGGKETVFRRSSTVPWTKMPCKAYIRCCSQRQNSQNRDGGAIRVQAAQPMGERNTISR